MKEEIKINHVIQINDQSMTVEEIMNEFKDLTEVDFEFVEIPLSKVKKDLQHFELGNDYILHYLTKYTPNKTVNVIGTSVLTYEEIISSMKDDWPANLVAKFGLLPISYGSEGNYKVVDLKTGLTYMIDHNIYIGDNQIEMFEWDDPKVISRQVVLDAAEEGYDVNDHIYDQFIEFIIDLEVEREL